MRKLTPTQAKRKFAALLQRKLDEGMADLARERKKKRPFTSRKRLREIERKLLEAKKNEPPEKTR